ncbi:SDR family NAD(P)-dependent oxidoreductase [Croceicoccus hydrothermalis]|uniref:SDR family NAD(P)-dependent oxidoreductase n=1 Tax=Croceicoccus hydrothermalis TaxID=2867964 RepID=UPI001EFC04F9|nr:SDR family NAD(P)-dependent oxidoreductase [Croceicoccus hydrothermalis]
MKTAVITGASSGIGQATALELGRTGWRIIGVGRDPQRCEDAAAKLAAEDIENDFLRADFDSMAEVKRVAREIAALADRIDALVNNAGGVRDKRYETVDGFEATLAANHLAPFLLTTELLPILKQTAAAHGEARVIAVSSSAHEHMPAMNFADLNFENNFSTGAAYCQAKLANLLFSKELSRRYAESNIVAQTMHPGVISSNFYSYGDESMKSHPGAQNGAPPEHAARTIAWMATSPEGGSPGGRYFHDKTEVEARSQANDDVAAQKLWEMSEEMLKDIRSSD